MASPTRSATPSDTQKITAAHMTLRFGFMMGVSGWIQDDVARYTNPGEYINCSNPVCYSGGIKLGQPIRDMVRARETEKEGSKLYQGSEGVSERAADLSEMHQFFQVQDHDQVPHTRN